MFRSEKSEELTNKIEQLLSGQISLAEAKRGTNTQTSELLDLVDHLRKYQPAADSDFQANLEKKLLSFYRRPRLGAFAFRLGLKRMRVIAAGSAAALLLLSGMALALPGVRNLIVPPPSGDIEILSSPDRAKVYLDNALKGTTPIRLSNVVVGSHELKISKESHEDWSGALMVKQKKTLRVLVELNKIELVVVKPERKAEVAKEESVQTELPESTSSASEENEPSKEPPQPSRENGSVPESDQGSTTTSVPTGDSSANASEAMPSSESLLISSSRSLFSWGVLGRKETILADTSGITKMELSPSGGLIALLDSGSLKVIDSHTGDLKLTYKATGSIKNPRWSPSEDALLFTALDAESLKPAIFTVQISSKTARKLKPGTIGSWSPTSQEIVYAKETGGIFLTDSEGVKEQQIVPRMKVSQLRWSPSGIKIGFIGVPESDATDSGLYVVNKDGTDLNKLATNCTDFWWSPDGKTIALEKTEKLEWTINVVSPYGNNSESITIEAKHPRFSPDSQRIAFAKADGIYIASLAGENPVRLLEEPNLELIGWLR